MLEIKTIIFGVAAVLALAVPTEAQVTITDNDRVEAIGKLPWLGLGTYTHVRLVDGGPLTKLHATAWGAEYGKMLTIVFSDPQEAVALFSVGSDFRLFYQGNQIADSQMTGTAAAAAVTTQCNQAYGGNTHSDPFQATNPALRVDPFKGA
jgi:hypothetical protein